MDSTFPKCGRAMPQDCPSSDEGKAPGAPGNSQRRSETRDGLHSMRSRLGLLILDVQQVLDEAKAVRHHFIFNPPGDHVTEEDARWILRYDAVVAKLKELERVL